MLFCVSQRQVWVSETQKVTAPWPIIVYTNTAATRIIACHEAPNPPSRAALDPSSSFSAFQPPLGCSHYQNYYYVRVHKSCQQLLSDPKIAVSTRPCPDHGGQYCIFIIIIIIILRTCVYACNAHTKHSHWLTCSTSLQKVPIQTLKPASFTPITEQTVSQIFRNRSVTTEDIVNWRPGGERGTNCVYFMY
jgi:hypothetical protein